MSLSKDLNKLCEEIFDWDNILTEAIAFFTVVIAFIPLGIWHIFFKLTIKPIEEERFLKIKIKPVVKCGNLYFCVDKTAKRFWNKIFFIRIKKTT